jgi:hypothetical protein
MSIKQTSVDMSYQSFSNSKEFTQDNVANDLSQKKNSHNLVSEAPKQQSEPIQKDGSFRICQRLNLYPSLPS